MTHIIYTYKHSTQLAKLSINKFNRSNYCNSQLTCFMLPVHDIVFLMQNKKSTPTIVSETNIQTTINDLISDGTNTQTDQTHTPSGCWSTSGLSTKTRERTQQGIFLPTRVWSSSYSSGVFAGYTCSNVFLVAVCTLPLRRQTTWN